MEDQTANQAMPGDRERRRRAELKSKVKLWFHGVFWKTLWLLRIARPYSKVMCRLNLYRKFPDGRCHWCGDMH